MSSCSSDTTTNTSTQLAQSTPAGVPEIPGQTTTTPTESATPNQPATGAGEQQPNNTDPLTMFTQALEASGYSDIQDAINGAPSINSGQENGSMSAECGSTTFLISGGGNTFIPGGENLQDPTQLSVIMTAINETYANLTPSSRYTAAVTVSIIGLTRCVNGQLSSAN